MPSAGDNWKSQLIFQMRGQGGFGYPAITVRVDEPLNSNLMSEMHDIEYQVFGNEMQFVEIELNPQEAVVAEAGGMMFMEDDIEMETIFGDGSKQNTGFLGSIMGA